MRKKNRKALDSAIPTVVDSPVMEAHPVIIDAYARLIVAHHFGRILPGSPGPSEPGRQSRPSSHLSSPAALTDTATVGIAGHPGDPGREAA